MQITPSGIVTAAMSGSTPDTPLMPMNMPRIAVNSAMKP